MLKWIESFLTDRQQYVAVKGHSSDWKDVLSGIPQGSVLGPLLSLLYVNDFPDVIKSMLKLFADDAKIYQTLDKCDIFQDDLSEGGSWADKWELKFHVDKCGVMHYEGVDRGGRGYRDRGCGIGGRGCGIGGRGGGKRE